MRERQIYLDSTLRLVDQIVTAAPLARDLLVKRGITPANIRLVRYGLDFSTWQGLPRMPHTATLRIGYLGQVTSHKGVHLLIQAFQHLSSSATPLELKIYGDLTRSPQYVKQLERLAIGDPRIRFLGAYDNRRVESILNGIDVLVVPSLWFEVSPLVIMEAFAAGVPVVASRLPNIQTQVRHEIDGLLFVPDDPSNLACQLQRLIDEPNLLRQLAQAIRPVRTVDEEMAEMEELYRSVASEERAGEAATPV